MISGKTVVFVCLHGMGMSRLAAALFNHVAPTGWRAVSASLAPGAALSPTWGLHNTEFDVRMREEIRERAEALASSLRSD